MRKTAEFIEETKEARQQASLRASKTMPTPESKNQNRRKRTLPEAAKPYQFKPGQSGNPGGRPKNDLAKQIAQAIFENHADAICEAFRKALLEGNAYTFKELAERAYVKIKERVDLNLAGKGTLEEVLEARKRAGK